MPDYASPDNLPDPHRDDPHAADYITHASALVTKAIRRATFKRDPETGLPVSETIATILKDATVQQVTFWYVNDINPARIVQESGAGKTGVISRKSLDGASLTYAGTTEMAARLAAATTTLCDLAQLTLTNAGLIGGHPRVTG